MCHVRVQVFYVTDEHTRYLENLEEREEGGTPNIIGSIRCGLVFHLWSAVSGTMPLVTVFHLRSAVSGTTPLVTVFHLWSAVSGTMPLVTVFHLWSAVSGQ